MKSETRNRIHYGKSDTNIFKHHNRQVKSEMSPGAKLPSFKFIRIFKIQIRDNMVIIFIQVSQEILPYYQDEGPKINGLPDYRALICHAI